MADVEIEVKVLRTTDKAVQVDFGGKEPEWVPRSQISDYAPPSQQVDTTTTTIFSPEWLATEKGMV